jgi:hydrogenase nickel incorporation protein HypA/HybF
VHELSITERMFKIVLDHAQQAGASKVKGINLNIGSMTGVVGDSIRFYMEIISKGTIAEGADLNINEMLATAKCRQCARDFKAGEDNWTCPHCGSINIEITGGKELFVDSIEVE